jgi:hypothetical protein
MAVKYGVRAIPTAMLVAADGTVVSLNARGARLREQLEDLFGPPQIRGDWQAIIESLKQRLHEDPNDQGLLNELAIHQARAEHWADCAASFRKRYATTKKRDEESLPLAAALLLSGDHDAYQKLCGEFESGLGESPSARTLYLYARTLALDLESQDAVAVDPAHRSVTMEDKAWHKHTVAAAHLRAGDWDNAIAWANRSLEDETWPAAVCNWLVLAIAHHEQGNDALSRQWMTKSVAWFKENERRLNLNRAAGLPLDRHDWLSAEVLIRQAASRLESNGR